MSFTAGVGNNSVVEKVKEEASEVLKSIETTTFLDMTGGFLLKRQVLSKRSMYDEEHKIVFEDLDPATSYTIKVNTLLNGIVVASKEEKIPQLGLAPMVPKRS